MGGADWVKKEKSKKKIKGKETGGESVCTLSTFKGRRTSIDGKKENT